VITNDFFKGYYQALDTIEQDVLYLIKQYTDLGTKDSADGLNLVLEHIEQVRRNYRTLQRQLADGQKKK